MNPDLIVFERGSEVGFEGSRLVVHSITHDYHVIARDLDTGEQRKVPITDLEPICPRSATDSEPDISDPDDDDWAEARRRRAYIQPFLERRISRLEAEEIALKVGVAARTLHRWARKFRERRKLTALLPYRPNGGKGAGRLAPEIEALISTVIETFYKKANAPTAQRTVDEVIRQCRYAGIKPPSKTSIRLRIERISKRDELRSRSNAKLSRIKFDPKPGQYGEAIAPLSVVQIDHTTMDVIVVDQETRREIGRPIITLLIDVFSRMVLGCFITMDRPSALGTGLSIVHSVLPKESWLRARGIDNDWPCWGFPAKLHSDNGKDLRANSLRRACEQYSIAHDFRPLLKPEMGGHIERLMGTVKEEIHALPGTTKSSVKKRGEYRSAKHAVLTIPDVEYLMGEWITGVYHRRKHTGIGMPPLKKWEQGLFGDETAPGSGVPPRPVDETQILLDFLPATERTIQDYGIVWDGIRYYGDVLRPYIGASHPVKGRKFVFKRDPRDISKVFFLDPVTSRHVEIPYKNTTLPPMNIWELRQIQEDLAKDGRASVDEAAIFESYERMRERVAAAVDLTKAARRERERKRLHHAQAKSHSRSAAPAREFPEPAIDAEAKAASVAPMRKYAGLEPFATEEL